MARATNVKYEDGIFSMNIAGAYLKDSVTEINRSFAFTSDSVTVKDSYLYEGEHKIAERLVSYFEPVVTGDGRVLLGDTTVSYDPSVCTCRISSEATTRNPNTLCYMIDFELKDGVKEFSCTIK